MWKNCRQNFLNILQSSHVFCLQETKGTIKITDCRCYNVLRKNSRSGGLCIGIHQTLSKGVNHLNNTNDWDIQAVKLSKYFLKLKQDIILINVYNSPDNSSYKLNNQQNESIIELTSQYMSEFVGKDVDIMLVGDFNSRIATKENYMLPDR